MYTKTFPENKLKEIISSIDTALESGANPIAAFDADGTLWDIDIGEIFFHYQINNKLVDLPDNAWEYYINMKKNVSPQTAYLWLAQINKGVPIVTVRDWAKTAIDEASIPLMDCQKKIISHLQANNVKVYIVTASIKWSVEPAAALYNIPFENVIGVQTEVENDLVTDKQKGPITYKDGKVDGLLGETKGKKPFFCSGNTMGDFPLLESSTHLRLALNAADENHPNYSTEQELLSIAKKQDWFFHSFLG